MLEICVFMKKQFLILYILLFSKSILAQKVVNNPDFVGKNLAADVTKIECSDRETILYFKVNGVLGSSFIIPRLTYIEDAGLNGERLYITKSEGLNISELKTISNSGELRYKLFFPPLGNNVIKINYGEANPNGTWYIYKLDLSKHGYNFLSPFKSDSSNGNWKTVIGYSSPESSRINKNLNSTGSNVVEYASTGDIILPKELPKDFFGNWYDKYGTLILIATPEYMVSNSRVHYYRDIRKIGNKKFEIKSSAESFEILNLNANELTLRTDKLSALKKRPNLDKVPELIKGNWLHWGRIKKITITENYFYNDDDGDKDAFNIIKSRIDNVAMSDSGDLIWIVLYKEGNYNLYITRKINGEYTLVPRGFAGARYKKVKY